MVVGLNKQMVPNLIYINIITWFIINKYNFNIKDNELLIVGLFQNMFFFHVTKYSVKC